MTSPRPVSILRLPHGQNLPLPQYATPGSSGVDLIAATSEPLLLLPGEIVSVPAGICLELPTDLEAQIRSRSGLALRHGIVCLNSPGTIDSDYRGEICVILINHSLTPFTLHRGDRMAQLVICPIVRVYWQEVSHLDETERGDKGFGSSGIAAA